MTYLRIIDQPGKAGDKDQVQILLHTDDEQLSHTAEFDQFKTEEYLEKQLTWYFKEYQLSPFQEKDKAQRVPQALISLGKTLGEALLSDDYPLYVIIEKMDEIGFEKIPVRVESDRPEFFSIPWETLIVPDSNRFLSTSCSGFHRSLKQENLPKESVVEREGKRNVLIVLSRPEELDGERVEGSGMSIRQKLLEADESVNTELLYAPSWQKLEQRLLDQDKPVDLLHFDGMVSLKKETEPCMFALENEQGKADWKSSLDFAELIEKSPVEMLILDYHLIADKKVKRFGNQFYYRVATELLQKGVKSLVTLSRQTISPVSQRIFQDLYGQLLQGISLTEAVVRSRRVFQSAPFATPLLANKEDIHDWPLLLHYGQDSPALFKDPQEMMPLFQSPVLGEYKGNLLGFRDDMLPPQELLGGESEFIRVSQLSDGDKPTLIHGNAGSGKTTLLHQLAWRFILTGTVKKAFYFNFQPIPYTKTEMLQMIGPILDLEGKPEETLQKLKEEPYLIVLDQIDPAKKSGEHFFAERYEELLSFMQELQQGNSKVLFGFRDFEAKEGQIPMEIFPIPGLNRESELQFATSVIKSQELEGKENDTEYARLINFLQGHPALLKTLLPNLKRLLPSRILGNFSALLDVYNAKELLTSNQVLKAMFEFGWENLNSSEEAFLIALSDRTGILFDVLTILATKDEKAANPYAELFKALQFEAPETLSEILEAGTLAGILVPSMSGRELSPDASQFLDEKRQLLNWDSDQTKTVRNELNKLLALGFSKVAVFLSQKPNESIMHHLMMNRRAWGYVFEELWNKKEFRYFKMAKNHLYQMAKQAGINKEMEDWWKKLLNEFDPAIFRYELSTEMAIGWLDLAGSIMETEGFQETEPLQDGVQFWIEWVSTEGEKKDQNLFAFVLMFLESWYRKKEDWEGRRSLSLLSLDFYEKLEDYEKMVTTLLSLVVCEDALGNQEKQMEYENRLLTEIPYDKLQEGTQQNTLLQLAGRYANREELDHAKTLLEKFDQLPEIRELTIVSNTIRGEILFKEENFEKAASLLGEIWKGLIKQEHRIRGEFVGKLMAEIEQKIGEEKLSELLKAIDEELPTPTALAKQMQEQAEQMKAQEAELQAQMQGQVPPQA